MTAPDVQDILNRAEQLHQQGARVDLTNVGLLWLGATRIAVRHEIWLALRAMKIGRSYPVEVQHA